MALSHIIAIMLISASFLAIAGIIYFNTRDEGISKFGESIACKTSFIGSSDPARWKCDTIPVEIESNDIAGAKKGLRRWRSCRIQGCRDLR